MNGRPTECFRRLARLYREGDVLARILEIMFTRDEAELYLDLPGTAERVARGAGVDVKEAGDALEHGFRAGLLYRDAARAYSLVQPHNLAEMILGDARNNVLGDEYMELWRQLRQKRHEAVLERGVERDAVGRRVLPLTDHVHDVVLPFDDAADVVRHAELRAVGQCSCRMALERCDAPTAEICLAFDDSARHMLERGAMREVDEKECLEILRRGAEAGLVHMSSGLYHENSSTGVEFICNCCTCCCNLLYPYLASGRKLRIGRPFVATLHEELCSGCEDCVERCPFGAVFAQQSTIRIDEDLCVGCGQCALVCPEEAVALARREGEGFEPTRTRHGWVGPMSPPRPAGGHDR
jgi:Pyruvate/2-oxoacid:ferredoxin oxidoreductase delta subunit